MERQKQQTSSASKKVVVYDEQYLPLELRWEWRKRTGNLCVILRIIRQKAEEMKEKRRSCLVLKGEEVAN